VRAQRLALESEADLVGETTVSERACSAFELMQESVTRTELNQSQAELKLTMATQNITEASREIHRSVAVITAALSLARAGAEVTNEDAVSSFDAFINTLPEVLKVRLPLQAYADAASALETEKTAALKEASLLRRTHEGKEESEKAKLEQHTTTAQGMRQSLQELGNILRRDQREEAALEYTCSQAQTRLAAKRQQIPIVLKGVNESCAGFDLSRVE